MLGNMFEDEDDLAQTAVEEAHGAIPQYYQRRAGHCASDLDLPPQERQESNFVGLINQ